ncbi:MAG: penicillin-binding transpeptidase domain-containing protein [Sphingobacteriales bacterium JAD_PAG50586_3]|nr:MAG: penicillin-binding transpeptidase domain-containing protein [Sphingobacteriales bacterium JAD_PAG50586_3]
MKQLSSRQYLIAGIVVAICFTYIGRLFYIQIIDEKYKIMAVNNAIRRIVDYPPRGVVYDRTGKLLVANQAAYDLMVIPNQVKDCDTMELCRLVSIDKQGFKDRFAKLKKQKHPWYQPAVFEGQLSGKAYAALQEKLYDFQGFYVQSRTIRNYPKNVGAHLLGYVGEVNEKIVEDSSYYQMGDYIGLSGIEKSYEVPLRGIRGVRHVEKDVFNRERAAFAEGRYDTLGIAGVDLTSSIDLDLQEYGEKLMKNKIGSIVAIEPGTGEILALVSSPTYDPNLLVGHERSKNYVVLLRDTMKPLFNRALMASYPPGSTFKIANALVGQEVGVVTPDTRYSCNRGFSAGGVHVGCHAHASPVDLKFSITTSCNAYYCNVFRSIVEHYKPSEAGYRTYGAIIL